MLFIMFEQFGNFIEPVGNIKKKAIHLGYSNPLLDAQSLHQIALAL